jgi:hypothetical protein
MDSPFRTLGEVGAWVWKRKCEDSIGAMTQRNRAAGNFMARLDAAKDRFIFPVMLAVMLILVFMEYRYNVDLLNSISDPTTKPEMAEELSTRGKLLASFGLVWALFRNLAFRLRNVLAGVFVIVALTFSGYLALNTIYDRVIDRLPPDIKVMGFNLLFYRHDLLSGDLEDSDIPKMSEDPVNGKIFMGAFPMVLLDDRFIFPAQSYVIRRADLKIEEALRVAEEKWPKYQESMDRLNSAHAKYLEYSRKAAGDELSQEWGQYALKMQELNESHGRYLNAVKIARRETDLSSQWDRYNGQMNDLRARHKEFVDGSRKVASYGGKARNNAESRFREASGGLSPDSSVPLSEFPALLKRSRHAKKVLAEEARTIGHDADGSPVRAGEIPYFLSRSEFEEWCVNRAVRGLQSVNLPTDRVMNREQFVDWARTSDTPGGRALREHEAKNYGTEDKAVPGKEIPYFLDQAEFIRWTGHKVTKIMMSYDMPPNVNLGRDDFLDLLRKSPGTEGQRMRDTENRVFGTLPDGTELKIKDIPYFMEREIYFQWMQDESERLRAQMIPTEENVNDFANINQVNAAIFVPPMAIVSSLTSALVNALSLMILLFASVLIFIPVTRSVGYAIRKLCVPLMIVCFFALVYLMPSHVFQQGTELYNLETKFHERIGVAAELWSRLSNVQKLFLE